MFWAETLYLSESVRSIFLFALSLHLNTPLSSVVNNRCKYLLFITFQTLIDFIRLRSRFVRETVRL